MGWFLGAAIALSGTSAPAGPPVGAVAAVEGQAEVQHPGDTEWHPVSAGDAVIEGDRLRTLAQSKLKLLFDDESVLTLAPDSELTVDAQVIPEQGGTTSSFSLLVGMVRALVSEDYAQPGASFELETPTAVAGVRGTSFIATHDASAEETMIVGLTETTVVRSKADAEGAHTVEVGAGQSTSVGRGSFPLPPSQVPDSVLKSLTASTAIAAAATGAGALGGRAAARGPAGAAAQPSKAVDQPVQELRDIQKATKRGGRPVPPPPPVP
jgi:hypothetical protein